MDTLGLEAAENGKKCCCCATQIKLSKPQVIKNQGGTGHKFKATFLRDNVEWSESYGKDCTLEWWEKWEDYTGRGDVAKWYPRDLLQEKWVELLVPAMNASTKVLPSDANPFRHWINRGKSDVAEKLPPITVTDQPYMKSVPGKETTRTIHFYLRLVSSCPKDQCSSEAVAFCAKEVIKFNKNGAITERKLIGYDTCSPGFISSFPPTANPTEFRGNIPKR